MINLKKEIKIIEDTMVQLYNDKMNNTINQQMFSLMSVNYSNKLEEVLKSISDCDRIIKRDDISDSLVNNWINALVSLKNCKLPTTNELSMIIDKIFIHPVESSSRFTIKWKIVVLGNTDFINIQQPA